MKTVHRMNLHASPFRKTVEGRKVIEMRLNDGKRRSLKIGDEIEFSNRDNPTERAKVEITDLKQFSTFKDICETYNPSEYGSESKDSYVRMYQYYSPDDEARFGTLAIRFRLL
jgi:ASC-1-like (ASCH) protein